MVAKIANNQSTERPAFDYGSLEESDRILIMNRTAEIHGLIRMTSQAIIKIGRKLTECRSLLKGRFVDWLNAEFAWSERNAYNFISAYEKFGDSLAVSNIAPSALYLLSAPSAPDDARREAIRIAGKGETVTHKQAKRLITHYVSRPDESKREIKPELQDSPALFYVNRLTMAIQNGDLDLREDRLTYALHNLAGLIKQRVPLHPPIT